MLSVLFELSCSTPTARPYRCQAPGTLRKTSAPPSRPTPHRDFGHGFRIISAYMPCCMTRMTCRTFSAYPLHNMPRRTTSSIAFPSIVQSHSPHPSSCLQHQDTMLRICMESMDVAVFITHDAIVRKLCNQSGLDSDTVIQTS